MTDSVARADYLELAKWVAESIANSQVMSGHKVVHTWRGGMPRGVRGTDLLNALFNWTYSVMGAEPSRLLPKRTDRKREARQGDDIWHKCQGVVAAICSYCCFTTLGIRCATTTSEVLSCSVDGP